MGECKALPSCATIAKNVYRSAVIQLHSVLHTYRETFHDSTNVSKTFRLHCDFCYKPHFALFSCNFLTTGLTCWSRLQIYQSNDYVSQESESTHSSLAFKDCALLQLCTFLQLLCIFMILIRPYIKSLPRTLPASDQSCN